VKFLDPSAQEHLSVPALPYSEISKLGASMYRGRHISCAESADIGTSGYQLEGDGENPISALQNNSLVGIGNA